MDLKLHGKAAVINGATQGIGLELFEVFPLGPTGKAMKRELADTIEKLRGTP